MVAGASRAAQAKHLTDYPKLFTYFADIRLSLCVCRSRFTVFGFPFWAKIVRVTV
jgi:hypothetical protein